MEGTGWVRGLRYLIEGCPYTTARRDGGCYDMMAILSRGDHWHTSKGTVAHGEFLFGAIRTLTRYLPALIGASEQTISSSLPQLASSSFRRMEWNWSQCSSYTDQGQEASCLGNLRTSESISYRYGKLFPAE